MKLFFGILFVIVFGVCSASVFAQPDEVLADGTPPLTRGMTERIISYWGYILNVKLTDAQHKHFQKSLIDIWENQDFKQIGMLSVEDETAKQFIASSEAEKQRTRNANQEKWVKSLRSEITTDKLSQFLVSVYDEQRKNFVISCNSAETPSKTAATRLLRIGRYEGEATNQTAGFTGKTALDLNNIDPNGKITARIYFYAGLEGDGVLTGTVGESGKLTLSGKFSDSQLCIQGAVNTNALAADFRIEDSIVQTGILKAAFKGQATNNPVSDKYPPSLIGKWAFDDYLRGTRASNVGPNLTAGYSKRLTFEFFEDGTYKYIETNQFCPTGSTCCRNNNQLEKGAFSITAVGFDFAFKSGDMMHTDQCNPKQGATAPMKAADAHVKGMHKWAIGPTGDNNVLTFCLEQGGKTVCFQRTQ